MSVVTKWEQLSQEAKRDRRKGKRLPLAFPIEISGFDRAGHLFCERTATRNISEAGCCFRLKTPVARGDVVAIKLVSRCGEQPAATRPLLFQIVWVHREGNHWKVGALKLQPENIWHVAFPPGDQPKTSSA